MHQHHRSSETKKRNCYDGRKNSHAQLYCKIRHQNVFFLLAPLAVWALLFWSYAIGPDWARNIVSPESNREFGALENLQNLLLMASFVLVFNAWRRATDSRERLVFLLCMGFVGFLFLEEIDYGQTYIRLITNSSFSLKLDGQDFRAFHNLKAESGRELGATVFEPLGKYLKIGLFVVTPLLLFRNKNSLVRKMVPSLWFIPLALSSIWCENVVRSNRGEVDGSLVRNFSEFNELYIYYLGLLYLLQITSDQETIK